MEKILESNVGVATVILVAVISVASVLTNNIDNHNKASELDSIDVTIVPYCDVWVTTSSGTKEIVQKPCKELK